MIGVTSYMNNKQKETKTFIKRKEDKGYKFITDFLDYLPHESIVVFHNLGFDWRMLIKFSEGVMVKSQISEGKFIKERF